MGFIMELMQRVKPHPLLSRACHICGREFASAEITDTCRMCINIVESQDERFEKLKDKGKKDPSRYLSA
jgi:hypothetical protein